MAGRLHAYFLHRFSPHYNRLAGDLKRDLFSALNGDVLEVGAGTGANFAYLPPGIHWTGCDPNPHTRRYSLDNARRHGIAANWVTAPAERLPFPDSHFHHILCTLTLCSVAAPATALSEIRRVLRPGGTFVFLEHVAAPPHDPLCSRQRRWRPAFQFFCGCTPDRDTLSLIGAAGFASLDVQRLSLPVPIVTPHIAGAAVR